MMLAIDIGNTNIKIGEFDGDDLIRTHRFETYGDWDFSGLEMPDAVWVSSVVPALNDKLKTLCQDLLGIEPVFVSAQNAGIAIKVERPGQVGADRLVNAVAVQMLYQKPAVVLDFGTATTFDVVDSEGAYVGGVIAPGPNLSVKALEQAAAQLPEIKIEKPGRAIGQDTVGAMQAGVYYGYLGLVERIVKEITMEMDADPFVLATGGLAGFFAEESVAIDAIDPDLTLKGLQILYKNSA